MKIRRISIAIISVIVIASFLFGSTAVASNPVVFSANTINVKVMEKLYPGFNTLTIRFLDKRPTLTVLELTNA